MAARNGGIGLVGPNGLSVFGVYDGHVGMSHIMRLVWSDAYNPDTYDLRNLALERAGDGTLAQRNGTFAQESQLYGSYSSGYQRVVTRSLRQAITAAAGATLVSTISIPKFSHLIGVTTRVNTTLGTTNGTTGYTIGDGTDADLWGDKTGTAIGTTTDAADYTAVDALGPSMTDRNITITATGGNFDGTGVIEVCAFFLRAEAD